MTVGISQIITSPGNARVRQVRALRQRAAREQTGLFFVEGIRAVTEALGVEALVVAPALLRSPRAWELFERIAPDRRLEVSAEVFRTLSCLEGPQGIGAVARQQWNRLAQADPGTGLCWVALESVQYPGNLGTILRTSEAVGGAGVILVGPATDPYDPQAVRASMGAIFSQRLVRTDLASLVAWARGRGCAVIGTSPAATTDYQELAYPAPLVLLMGSEQHGLSAACRAVCDAVVRIPMVGRCDSLNLAVSAGTVLYEVFNQGRRSPAQRKCRTSAREGT